MRGIGEGAIAGTDLVLVLVFRKPKHPGHNNGPSGKTQTRLWLNWPYRHWQPLAFQSDVALLASNGSGLWTHLVVKFIMKSSFSSVTKICTCLRSWRISSIVSCKTDRICASDRVGPCSVDAGPAMTLGFWARDDASLCWSASGANWMYLSIALDPQRPISWIRYVSTPCLARNWAPEARSACPPKHCRVRPRASM